MRLQVSDFRKCPLPVREIAKRDPAEEEKLNRLREEYRQEKEKEAKTNTLSYRLAFSGIPKRLKDNMPQVQAGSPWAQRLATIEGKIGTGFIFGLIGGYGTGKSQMGVALTLKAIETVNALFVHAPDMLDTIKDVYRSSNHETVRGQLERFTKPGLLVIDEINQGISEADIRYLHRIICERYDDTTDTLLISNESKPNFQKLVGDRVISRMVEVGGIIETRWPSFRKPKP